MVQKDKLITGIFFFSALGFALYLCYLIFTPFLGIIFVAGAFSVSFYDSYRSLSIRLRNRKSLAAGLICLAILFCIIVPLSVFIFFLSKTSLEAYSALSDNFNQPGDLPKSINQWTSSALSFLNLDAKNFGQYISTLATSFNQFLLSGVTTVLKGSTELLVKLFIMLLTIFFLLRDGRALLERVIKLTPLPDHYDRQLFQKFREVSYSALVSTVVTGMVQGVVAGFAYAVVGVPFLLFGVATAFASLIPFVGAASVWIPVTLYLIITGQWWQAVFLGLWGVAVISLIDNILRPLLMKGKTQVHPMILFFSIFGGITFFGFWGVIFGPLIISVALTLLHIYEAEYCGLLNDCLLDKKKSGMKRDVKKVL